MSFCGNPSFYISIFSSICLISSEILPFIPSKGNGILHTILEILSSFNKKQNNIVNNKETQDETTEMKEVVVVTEIEKTKENLIDKNISVYKTRRPPLIKIV